MAKLTWEWGNNRNVIIVRKKRGKITQDELIRFMNESGQYNVFGGALMIQMFRVNGTEYLDDGYLNEDSGDDTAVLYILDDGGVCPVCGALREAIQYCPECGHRLDYSVGTE